MLCAAVHRATLAGLTAIALGAASTLARADDDDRAKALATDLFDRGVKLMIAHKCDEAQPIPEADRAACSEALDSFVKASKVYPRALGAFRNAAFVARGLGKVALAARSFREVARRAPLEASKSRKAWAEPARREADALEPRVPHVTVFVTEPVPDGLVVKIDGEALDKSFLKTPIALDPGDHEIAAEAPDHRPAAQKVTLAEKEQVDVKLDLPAIPKPAAALPVLPPVASSPPPPPPTKTSPNLAPIFVTAGGAVVLGVGLAFGEMAKSARDDGCDVTAKTCTSQSDLDRARSRANVSTALTIAGGAITAAGAVWWIAVPKKTTREYGISPWIAPGSGGLVAAGALP